MTYAILDSGAVVSTADDLGDGFYKITINGKEYVTGNIKLWAVECGYTIEDTEDIELKIHPMYPAFPIFTI
ncbi:MAG: hypothetical protein ACTSV7_00625 [Candidatus Baldrarchaeia archaeon]